VAGRAAPVELACKRERSRISPFPLVTQVNINALYRLTSQWWQEHKPARGWPSTHSVILSGMVYPAPVMREHAGLRRLGLLTLGALLAVFAGACDGEQGSAAPSGTMGQPIPSPRPPDASQLEGLIPKSALPEGFEEFYRGPAIMDAGSEGGEIPPSLIVGFRNAEGSSATFMVIAEQDERAARQQFDRYVRTSEEVPYGTAKEPDLSGKLQPVIPCNTEAGPPPAENACAYQERPALKVGTEARAFASVAPIQGKDSVVDTFLRGTVVASLWIEAIPGSDLPGERERLAEEFDSRIRALIEE